MKRLFVPLTFVAIGVGLAGCAGGTSAYGGIQKIDTTAHTVTLYTGDTFTFPASEDLSKWKVGDDVHVTYTADTAAKKNNATAIKPYP